MKKIFLAICIALMAFVSQAQEMLIHKTDGSVTAITLKDIDSITFNANESSNLVPLHDPVLALQFNDDPYNHNMHIASDGAYYYTCNGGGYNVGKINKYTLSGTFIASYPIAIDMRSIMYNKVDGKFYVSGFEATWYETNIYKITDLVNGAFIKVLSNVYDNGQSGTALSSDCQYFYAQNAGTVKKYKLSDGILVQTLTGLSSDNSTVAVDQDYIYTWVSSSQTVYVYDQSGSFIESFVLPSGNYPFSLSFEDGLIFVSIDGNYSTGTWYGYNIRKSLIKQAVITTNNPILYLNRVVEQNDSSK